MIDIWEIEQKLWLDDVEAYAHHLASDCIMAFGPMGLMTKSAILDSLRKGPRWASVEMTGKTVVTPGQDITVLGYRAEAIRNGDQPYRALCTSTYVLVNGEPKLAQHQQTVL